jgi:hypothetical protein
VLHASIVTTVGRVVSRERRTGAVNLEAFGPESIRRRDSGSEKRRLVVDGRCTPGQRSPAIAALPGIDPHLRRAVVQAPARTPVIVRASASSM